MTDILNTPVLVLNKHYVPIDTTTVKDAFVKLWGDIAEAVIVTEQGAYESYDFKSWSDLTAYREMFEEAEFISTPSIELMVPRVIRTIHYDRMSQKKLQPSRRNIYDRDAYTCQYCGKRKPTKELNLDHVIPQAQGGKSTWTNLVCACIKCNSRKDCRTPAEAHMPLLRQPFMPHVSFRLGVPASARRNYKSWSHFVSDVYWNIPLEEE